MPGLQDSKRKEHKMVLNGISGTFSDCWAARKDLVVGEYAGVCDETTSKKVMSWDFR